ncbi:DUF1178 family protein [Aestuariivirga litoralis]|uniref:DUF1178 family protein n=1 Tax=Aestuariivirga litoralis TaxID=2650924 RepID=UPI0018C59809|nr:DUF1178 family protein [Aestuariivirga litoralis]MBG1233546.1 DUF1178 family protein [Aestuariivirga litoralis]
MIHYDLQCAKGHEFDGWFASIAAFDKQLKRGLVTCSHCGSTEVEKQLMAPGIPAKSNTKPDLPVRMAGGADPRAAEMMRLMREYRKHVDAHSEDVGTKFAEEARKIHYKESEERGIRGQATRDEAIELMEEGIAVHPLPMLPEDGN